MTKEYRARYTIISKMLEIVKDNNTEGVTKTLIMYRAYLSYAQLKEYLTFLLEKGLLEELPKQITTRGNNEKFVYRITGKGIRILAISKEIESLVGLD